ncbi:hypothetical protein [Tenacibaculum sp. M341]|uniref:hypothetical protein n=1 Tax=Tenacibaculum sp. M341 TaxID=2530339 RepID=UPI00104EAD2B|nr:hypothetical protein [Tenacibaculum sp. M341]TCI90625.1 hypothetical protein EYW44_12945 [Tenacibaculum sp. M341]
MLSTDATYLKAKKIKDGTAELQIEFKELYKFLKKEYAATLLNADVYFEPVFKSLAPSLRLLIDNSIQETTLPVYFLDRNDIKEQFLSICNKYNSNLTANITNKDLRIEYYEFDEIFFHEALKNISYFDVLETINNNSIVKMIPFFNQFFFFFENQNNLNNELKNNSKNIFKSKIIELLKRKGYNGKRLSEVFIFFDLIDSIEKAGGVYNYLR